MDLQLLADLQHLQICNIITTCLQTSGIVHHLQSVTQGTVFRYIYISDTFQTCQTSTGKHVQTCSQGISKQLRFVRNCLIWTVSKYMSYVEFVRTIHLKLIWSSSNYRMSYKKKNVSETAKYAYIRRSSFELPNFLRTVYFEASLDCQNTGFHTEIWYEIAKKCIHYRSSSDIMGLSN